MSSPDTTTGQVAPPRRRRRRRRAAAADGAGGEHEKSPSKLPSIAATTAVTAVITAIVGGVLSQDRIDSVFGDDEPSETSTAETTAPPEYQGVTESTRAITVDVPASWGLRDDGFVGIPGIDSPGSALRTGPDPNDSQIQSDETAYVGASTQALDDLGLVGLDSRSVVDALERRREGATHLTSAGCVPTNDHTPELGDEWLGAVQAWKDCFAIDGWRAIEVEMVSVNREIYVFVQIGLPASTPDEVAQRLLDSLDVLPANLPVS